VAELEPVAGLQLLQQALDVLLDGAGGEVQAVGDLPVREALADQVEDLRLAGRHTRCPEELGAAPRRPLAGPAARWSGAGPDRRRPDGRARWP
jgi:hypothetical protein